MRLPTRGGLLAAALLLTACGGTGSGPATLETDDQKASYGIGLDMGRSLEPAKGRLDLAAFQKGIEDAMSGAEPALDQAAIQDAIQVFSQSIMEARQKEQDELGQKNQAEGEAYLAQNGAREGVVTTESGLQYEVLREGDGPRPTNGQQVRLHYKGTLIDGKEFDSSYSRNEPAVFPVGGLIAGFNEALELMPVGSHWRIVIPGDLAYGPGGTGQDIGPNATLIFEIELLEIVE
ncbi:MAG: peptidyl-prolyl cis-trans isomerase [Gemmatimonadota bacterium]